MVLNNHYCPDLPAGWGKTLFLFINQSRWMWFLRKELGGKGGSKVNLDEI